MVRVCVALVCCVLLGACARDPSMERRVAPAGSWRVEVQADRITDAPPPSALLFTLESSHESDLFADVAELQLTCFKGQPIVKLEFQFRVGNTRNSSLAYRFDDRPGHEIGARFLLRDNTVLIEDQSIVSEFLTELMTAKTLVLRVTSLTLGRAIATFDVLGGREAVDRALGTCINPVLKEQLQVAARNVPPAPPQPDNFAMFLKGWQPIFFSRPSLPAGRD